ncbi:MAG: delta-60 repeat domain-containing protein [Rhodanobacteraceae bacterium]|nr:delta-60 repeat domain-containing protein [Rhodanobacteraceae bacterium]
MPTSAATPAPFPCHPVVLALLLLLACARLAAWPLDAGFRPQPDDSVLTVLQQADGRILAGGNFGMVAGEAHNRLVRVHVDGSLDASFAAAADGAVVASAQQVDGRLLIAGLFASVNGQPRAHLARLLADGSLDPGFAPQVNGAVAALLVLGDGRILIGGSFTQVNATARQRAGAPQPRRQPRQQFLGERQRERAHARAAARRRGAGRRQLHHARRQPAPAPGAPAAGWRARSRLQSRADGDVDVLVQAGDGRIYASGLFATVGGQPRARIAALAADGSVLPGFAASLDLPAAALLPQDDLGVLAAGPSPASTASRGVAWCGCVPTAALIRR